MVEWKIGTMAAKQQILDEIGKILDSENIDSLQLILHGEKNVTIDKIDEFIKYEVKKAVDYYSNNGKINKLQASEIAVRATNKLISEKVTSENKIKHVVKDYIIHTLARDLKAKEEREKSLFKE